MAAMCMLGACAICCFAAPGASRTHTEAAASAPIIPGDHPDPTIIRVGETYWTTSTSGGWGPEFELFRSSDLRHWNAVSSVFPHTPDWATDDFWAPELVYDAGHPEHSRILLYYVARKRGGPLCVAAATANDPAGPYTDHGPILCQTDGSIDPSFVRDEHGRPYLVWKEDGNSIGKPTPIYAQPLTPDLLHLTGEKTQLIVNQPTSWEGGVVEGPYIMHHGNSFYLFYAGGACCGEQCNYAEGVARSAHLLGPWQKDPANPIIRPNGAWKCPGHGTAVQTPKGGTWFVFHAYPAKGSVYLGRESLLDHITWAHDGWPVLSARADTAAASATRDDVSDNFTSPRLSPEWRWPIGDEPAVQTGGGALTVQANGSRPVLLARSLNTLAFTSTVRLENDSASEGLGIFGAAHHELVLMRTGQSLELVRNDSPTDRNVLWHTSLPGPGQVWVRVASQSRPEMEFSYSLDGHSWTPVAVPETAEHMPAWDQGLRVGLFVSGDKGAEARFGDFALTSNKP